MMMTAAVIDHVNVWLSLSPHRIPLSSTHRYHRYPPPPLSTYDLHRRRPCKRQCSLSITWACQTVAAARWSGIYTIAGAIGIPKHRLLSCHPSRVWVGPYNFRIKCIEAKWRLYLDFACDQSEQWLRDHERPCVYVAGMGECCVCVLCFNFSRTLSNYISMGTHTRRLYVTAMEENSVRHLSRNGYNVE